MGKQRRYICQKFLYRQASAGPLKILRRVWRSVTIPRIDRRYPPLQRTRIRHVSIRLAVLAAAFACLAVSAEYGVADDDTTIVLPPDPNPALYRALPVYTAAAMAARVAGRSDSVALDLPAGPLSQSLLLLGEQAALSLIFPRDAVDGFAAPEVRGRFPVGEIGDVLDDLFDGACLSYTFVTDQLVAIRPGCVSVAAAVAQATRRQPTEPLPPMPDGAPPIEELLVRGEYVTGSRIRNPGYAHPTPVDLIERDEIELSGKQSLSELLRYVPAVSGNSTSTLVTNGGDGSATVTLRGLPASNTLVLLNGRRINPDAFRGEAVNLNTLPLELVERVEILKDGASAVYGSDAVAGVVNVVTRECVDGVRVNAYFGSSGDDDLETLNFNITGGFQTDRMTLTLGATHYDQRGIFSRDRAVSRSSDDRNHGGIDKRSSATVPSRIGVGGEPVILIDGQAGDDPTDYRPATSEDRFEYRDYTSLIVPSRRWSVFGTFGFELSERLRVFAEVLVTDTTADNELAPTPVFTGFESIDLPVSAANPYNPFGVTLYDVRRRVTELGPRIQHNQTSTDRFVAGLEGQQGPVHWTARVPSARSARTVSRPAYR